MRVRRGREHGAALGGPLQDAEIDRRVLLQPLRQLEADVTAADDGHLQPPARAVRVHPFLHLLHRLGRAHDDHLVAGLQLRVPSGHEHAPGALDRDDEGPARQVQAADGGRGERRALLEPVFEQPHDAAGEHLRIDRARSGDDALDVRGQLRLGPDHAIDPERGKSAARTRAVEELGARLQADRLRVAQAVGQRAGHDVHLVEPGGRNEEVALGDARAGQDLLAGAAPEDELGVDRLEHVLDVGILVDDEDLVFGGEGSGQRRPDLTATDDDDAHEGGARVTRTAVHGASDRPRTGTVT